MSAGSRIDARASHLRCSSRHHHIVAGVTSAERFPAENALHCSRLVAAAFLQSERNNLRIKAHGVNSTGTLLLRDRLQRLLLLRFLLLPLLVLLLLLLRFLLLLLLLLLLVLLLLVLLLLLLQAQGIQRVLLAHVAGVKRAC